MSTRKRLKLSSMAPSPRSTGSGIVRFYDPNVQAKDAHGRTQEQILAWSDSQLERSHNYIQVLFPLPEGSPFNWSAPVIDLETMEAFRARSDLRQGMRSSFERMLVFYGFTASSDSDSTTAGANEANQRNQASTEAKPTVESGGEGTKDAQALSIGTEETGISSAEEATSAAAQSTELAHPKSISQTSPSGYQVVRGENWQEASPNWCVRFDHNHLRITRILRCLRVLGLQQESEAFFAALKRVYDEPAVSIGARSMQFWTRAVERPLHLPPDDNEDECEWLKAWAKERANER
ncbi:hypothetical protein OPT61_g8890 [Boeremia exigua]|uniref:Uncharacterized protein n=1 Tax=Boeremia exigua TaxID=749465 RepID=A0ACC2HWB0_9PLEO|nr:hypothetical protein OPT61_g8890 [Boeremia exigua]